MIRTAIGNQLNAHLETLQELEKQRALYDNNKMDIGYDNLTHSIMHYEGRIKEARSILRIVDDLRGVPWK